ncbi:MAG: hypothetical protein AAGB31_07345 [Bdellovibrio sp.]
MKSILLISSLLLAFTSFAHAEETTGEKVDSAMETAKDKTKKAGRDAKRVAKKGAHRVQEAVCMEGDLKCAAKKAKNRVEEGADATVDKGKEVKDKLSH